MSDTQALGEPQPFGVLPDGRPAHLYTLRSATLQASITSYGARLVSLHTPDRYGVAGDIVLGYDSLHGYLRDQDYLGATIGRYANRIAAGRFVLQGVEYRLSQNEGANCLHGGRQGFDRQLWRAAPHGRALHERASHEHALPGRSVTLRHTSPAGEEGFPGAVEASVSYTLERDELRIDYHAEVSAATPLNLTNHSYFNLTGDQRLTVLGHRVTLFADAYAAITPDLLPTGELRAVSGTPFDFSSAREIGTSIDADDPQLIRAGGYDHNFVLRPGAGRLRPAAEVYEPSSGRTLHVSTNEPGLQFYTGNQLRGVPGKRGIANGRRCALCVETQHFPDSPHHPEFPSTVIEPGHAYRSSTVYRFSTR